MPDTPGEKQQTILRLHRIKGQIEALERSIGEGVTCRAALQQIAAVRGAVNGLMAEVLEMHLRRELPLSPESGQDANLNVDDIVALVRSYLK
ncbi:MAG: metal-sensing transcriptional repressor [Rhodospirillaceae bacterium]